MSINDHDSVTQWTDCQPDGRKIIRVKTLAGVEYGVTVHHIVFVRPSPGRSSESEIALSTGKYISIDEPYESLMRRIRSLMRRIGGR